MVHPPSDSDQVKQLSLFCTEQARAAGYRVKVFRCKSLRVVGGSGRHMNVLAPADASTIYRDLHQVPAVVAALGPAFIGLDPSRDPPNRRYTRRLGGFRRIQGDLRDGSRRVRRQEIVRGLRDMAGWGPLRQPGGSADPAVAHVRHRREQVRSCPRRGLRSASCACTGSPVSVVTDQVAFGAPVQPMVATRFTRAGLTLPAGTHWDVSADGTSWRITNASEVWKVDGRAYVNAAPNEHLRGPQTRCRGRARLVWRVGTKNAPRRKKERH